MATKELSGLTKVYGDVLTASSTTKQNELGALRFVHDSTYGLKVYRYVQAAADTTVANGTPLLFVNGYNGGTVTTDVSDTSINCPAGVGIGAIAASSYGWIQCGGYHSAVITDAGDDIAKGDAVIAHASTDGVVDRTAAGTAPVSKPFGFAQAADVDAADTVAVILTCVF